MCPESQSQHALCYLGVWLLEVCLRPPGFRLTYHQTRKTECFCSSQKCHQVARLAAGGGPREGVWKDQESKFLTGAASLLRFTVPPGSWARDKLPSPSKVEAEIQRGEVARPRSHSKMEGWLDLLPAQQPRTAVWRV